VGQGGFFSLPKARKEQKAEQVELLAEKLKKAKVAVLTDYRGLKVSQIQDLRGKLRGGDVEYRVVKNTLARRAAEAAGHPALKDELKGPVAIAFGYDWRSSAASSKAGYSLRTRSSSWLISRPAKC
jgi:large subunit ribosomal protein L10